MAIKSTAVTVGTSPTRLDTVVEADYRAGSALVPFNNSLVTVYVGGPDVSVANGVPVAAGTYGPSFVLDDGEAPYAIVSAGTADVRVLEEGI